MLHVHRAERSDRLVAALAEILTDPPADPLAGEVVSVHSRGIERWLAQRLSSRLGTADGRADGICANVRFPFPGRLVGQAVNAAVGVDPDDDPWPPERLVWVLLEVLEDHLDEPRLAPLRRHLGDEDDPTRRGRRFAAARRIADLFDRYTVHRPTMVRRWTAGDAVDGAARPLPQAASWQPWLWSRLHERLDVPPLADRLEDAVAALEAGLRVPDLPDRLALFGLTSLPASYMSVLAALGTAHDVHLLLLHPSPGLWDQIEEQQPPVGGDGPLLTPPLRDEDTTRTVPENPLLASWGRDAREMQLIVGALTRGAPIRHHPLDDSPPQTLLRRLQDDVRADREPPGQPLAGDPELRPELGAHDDSVQIHSCHGRLRQVEVMRDAILHLLADDPTLEPRDVIVMCPDIETFAPLIRAAFGGAQDAGAGEDDTDEGLPDVRVRLADRSLRRTNPVLHVIADLLDLASGRVPAPALLDLAAREPVRRRFRFDEADLERLEDWVGQLGIRWGLDAEHRRSFGLDEVAANTWEAGLERLLLGVAMADEQARMVGGVVPFDHVEGSDANLAGRFAEFLTRLRTVLHALVVSRPVDGWQRLLGEAADLLTDTAEADRWQRLQLGQILDDIVGEATRGEAASEVPLTLPEVRTLLEDRLRGRPSIANHRSGDLTVCTLVPMRSVPHRVVGLLGLDDGAFPRSVATSGDDLIELEPHVGDHDPRTEDRQLLLDALLAASDHLLVTYAGHDERTNESRPPCVPVGELLDAVDRTVRTADGRPARAAVTVVHPLQAHDPATFRPGALVNGRPFGFDPVALAGAKALAGPKRQPHGFCEQPLPPPDDESSVTLADLVRFVKHPVKAFCRQRLDLWIPDDEEGLGESIPIDLDGLEQWKIGDELLSSHRLGVSLDDCLAAARARGDVLPPGALADEVCNRVRSRVEEILKVAADAGLTTDGPGEAVPVEVLLDDGRSLVGVVDGIDGRSVATVTYSTLRAKQTLEAWTRLVALTAARPDEAWEAVLVGRSPVSRMEVRCLRLPPLGANSDTRRRRARELLHVLVDLRDRGLREPLPLYTDTSAEWAWRAREGHDADHHAAKKWTTTWKIPCEDRDRFHALVLGEPGLPFEQVTGGPSRPDELGDGWPADTGHRLGQYALRLWEPILEIQDPEDHP